VESSCEFGIEPSGSVKCWGTIEWPSISGLSVSAQLHIVSYQQLLEPMECIRRGYRARCVITAYRVRNCFAFIPSNVRLKPRLLD
jgi:hypothetical protein